MTCWHCDKELDFNFQTTDSFKFYHCQDCDKWYEWSKEKAKVNAAVAVRFFELEGRPQIQASV